MHRKKKSAINILSKEPAVIWSKGRIFQAQGKGPVQLLYAFFSLAKTRLWKQRH